MSGKSFLQLLNPGGQSGIGLPQFPELTGNPSELLLRRDQILLDESGMQCAQGTRFHGVTSFLAGKNHKTTYLN